METGKSGGLKRDVVYHGWPIAPSYMSPIAGGEGEYSCTHRAQINFGDPIFNLCVRCFCLKVTVPFSSPVTGVGSPIVKVPGEPELFGMGFTAVGQTAAAQGTLVRGQNIAVWGVDQLHLQ